MTYYELRNRRVGPSIAVAPTLEGIRGKIEDYKRGELSWQQYRKEHGYRNWLPTQQVIDALVIVEVDGCNERVMA